MATQNNLHIPDDLLSAVNEAASADGKTKDELAADALRRYLAHRKLEQLACEVDSMVELNRTSLLTMLSLDSYLKQPSLIVVHMDGFQKWKINSVHAKISV